MFICKNCKSIDKFELMFSPDYRGDKVFLQEYNKDGDIVITVDGYKFIPDLQFMNDHAVCKYCGQIYMWDYEGKNYNLEGRVITKLEKSSL